MTVQEAVAVVAGSLVDGAEWTLDGETIRETAERINSGYGWTWDEYHGENSWTRHEYILLSPEALEQAIALAEKEGGFKGKVATHDRHAAKAWVNRLMED